MKSYLKIGLISIIAISSFFIKAQGGCIVETVVLNEDAICNNAPWVIVFEDNFNGNQLDFSKWKIPYQGVLNDFNFTLHKDWMANYGTTPFIDIANNIEVSNGTLKIMVRRESPPIIGTYVTDYGTNPPTTAQSTFEYSSGWIESKKKFTNGMFEIRCKIPIFKGSWPAFWTFTGNPIWNEIDVFEFWNEFLGNNFQENKSTELVKMTQHFDTDANGTNESCQSKWNGPDFSEDFHTFTAIWDEFKIQWLIDGSVRRTSTRFKTLNLEDLDCNSINSLTPLIREKVFPNSPMNIIASIGVQNGDNNNPDVNSNLPANFEIDYIRYYKQITCNGYVQINSLENLDNDVYNVVTGTTIDISGNLNLANDQQLTVIGRDEINIGEGFNTTLGSDFNAYIDPSICNNVQRISNQFELVDSTKINSIQNSYNLFKIFPNPTNNFINIEFDNWQSQDCKLYLTNIENKIIFNYPFINDYCTQINLSSFSSGIYFLNVLNVKTNEISKNKIILSK